jgi:hypothetical protein
MARITRAKKAPKPVSRGRKAARTIVKASKPTAKPKTPGRLAAPPRRGPADLAAAPKVSKDELRARVEKIGTRQCGAACEEQRGWPDCKIGGCSDRRAGRSGGATGEGAGRTAKRSRRRPSRAGAENPPTCNAPGDRAWGFSASGSGSRGIRAAGSGGRDRPREPRGAPWERIAFRGSGHDTGTKYHSPPVSAGWKSDGHCCCTTRSAEP